MAKWYLVLSAPLNVKYSDRWDNLIEHWANKHSGVYESSERIKQSVFVPWKLIKAQIKKESSFNPKAESNVGARGLMQLMPATDSQIGEGIAAGFEVEKNVEHGIKYLVEQYLRFPEIPNITERWKFALASYNGGRGYINKALALARDANESKWYEWDVSSKYLESEDCVVNGKRPDAQQITDYVNKIITWWVTNSV